MSKQRKEYASKGVSPEVKEHTAEFAVALQARGVEIKTILASLSDTSYSPAERTLRLHMSSIKSGKDVVSSSKASGRHKALSQDEWAIVAGWILTRSFPVDFAQTIQWITAELGVVVSKPVLSRFIREFGLSVQLTGKRGMTSLTFHDYAVGYLNYLLELAEEEFFDFDHSKLVCLDFVTNSHRLDTETTIGMAGGKQQKFKKAKPTFTESYIVAAPMIAGLDLKPIMFSHNKVYSVDSPRAGEVDAWLEELGLDRSQVVYGESEKKYCKESQAQVNHFQAVNRGTLAGTRIIHDQGGAFKMDGEFIFEEDADCVRTMPPDQHGELSVLDNKLNAVAKNRWRAMRKGEDFAYDALILLKCLGEVSQQSITKWWRSNFMLDFPELTLEKVKAHLRTGKGNHELRDAKREVYLESYAQWEFERYAQGL